MVSFATSQEPPLYINKNIPSLVLTCFKGSNWLVYGYLKKPPQKGPKTEIEERPYGTLYKD